MIPLQIESSSTYLRRMADKFSSGEPTWYLRGRDVYVEWPKLELERRGEGVYPLNFEYIAKSLNMVREHLDCAEFALPAFLAMLSRYRDSSLLSPGDLEAYKDAAIGFKYAMDDPHEDKHGCCYFTENRQILYAACEYIAGTLFPDEVFTNNKQKGSWHAERGKRRLFQWIDWRARFGYSEWVSNIYYGENLLGLVLVWGMGEDEELKRKAGMLIELTLFDIALNAFDWTLATSTGRAYLVPTLRPELPATSAICRLYWGEGSGEYISLGAVALAAFDYRCSAAVKNVALDKAAIINRERMSLDVEDAKKYGLDPADYDNIMFFWGKQTFLHRYVIENSLKLCPLHLGMRPSLEAHWEKYQILEKAGFKPGRVDPLLPNTLIDGGLYDPDMACCALTQADIYSYRNAFYSLSNVQDFRKGKAGYQQHIWQANMGGHAVVFSTCPGSIEFEDRPNVFAGNRFMPRSVQHESIVLCVYRIPVESAHFFFTHLYFPRREFDEVREKSADGGSWIFGKRGGAYIAVFASVPGKWQDPNPDLYKAMFSEKWEEEFRFAKPWEYLVPGHAVVYVCEMGDEKSDGSFDDFVAAFKESSFEGDTFAFTYQSPFLGRHSFGWKEPLRVRGKIVAIKDYKRYDNPYCDTAFGEKVYRIRAGGEEITLDFN